MLRTSLFMIVLFLSMNLYSQDCEIREPTPGEIQTWSTKYLNGYYHCFDVPAGSHGRTSVAEDFNSASVWDKYNTGDSWITFWRSDNDYDSDGIWDDWQTARFHECQSCLFVDENVEAVTIDGKSCAKLKAYNYLEGTGRDTSWGYKNVDYTCATLKGDFGLNMGEFRSSFRMPTTAGLWTNFWSIDGGFYEIDVAENFTNNEILHNYYPNDSTNPFVKFQKQCDIVTLDSTFHEWGINWTPFKLEFVVDDQVFYTVFKYFNKSSLQPLDPECGQIINSGEYYENPYYLPVNAWHDIVFTNKVQGFDTRGTHIKQQWDHMGGDPDSCNCTYPSEPIECGDGWNIPSLNNTTLANDFSALYVDYFEWNHKGYDIIEFGAIECITDLCTNNSAEFNFDISNENRQSWSTHYIFDIDSVYSSNTSTIYGFTINSNTVSFDFNDPDPLDFITVVMIIKPEYSNGAGSYSISFEIPMSEFFADKTDVTYDYDNGTLCWPSCLDGQIRPADQSISVDTSGGTSCISQDGFCEVDLNYGLCNGTEETDTWNLCCKCPPGFDYDGVNCWSQLEFPDSLNPMIVLDTVCFKLDTEPQSQSDCPPGTNFLDRDRNCCEGIQYSLQVDADCRTGVCECPEGFYYDDDRDACIAYVEVYGEEWNVFIWEEGFYTDPICDSTRCCPEGTSFDGVGCFIETVNTSSVVISNNQFSFLCQGSNCCPNGYTSTPYSFPFLNIFTCTSNYSYTNNFTPFTVLNGNRTDLYVEPNCDLYQFEQFIEQQVDIRTIKDNNQLMEVYPNPADQSIIIKLYSVENISSFIVINSEGQKIPLDITRISDNEFEINTTNLLNGVYYIYSRNNHDIISTRFIIHH